MKIEKVESYPMVHLFEHLPMLKLDVVTGLIHGTDRSAQELLLVAHPYEGVSKQGANDNLSGTACILETGRTILELEKNGVIELITRSRH